MSAARSYPPPVLTRQLRHTRISNRVFLDQFVPHGLGARTEGIFTDQAVAYYEERAQTGLGMIILGGQVEKDAIYTPAVFPGLWNDDQVEGIARVARRSRNTAAR